MFAAFSFTDDDSFAKEISPEPDVSLSDAEKDLEEINNDDVGNGGVKEAFKVSTGCGPSPDREIEEIFANEKVETPMRSFTPVRDVPSRASKVSIGTSPPPQSISTQVMLSHTVANWIYRDFSSMQTYDAESFDAEPEPEPETFHYPSEGRFTQRGLRRSQSFASTSRFIEPQSMHRSMSRQSFSSELQVIEKFFNAFLISGLYISDGTVAM